MARMTIAQKKAAAEALIKEIREGLLNVEKNIIKFIETKAWEPLGYGSFAEAWKAELADIPLAQQALRAHVVYALLDAGMTPEDIAATSSGVTAPRVRRLKKEKDAGKPADAATGSHHVPAHERRNPSPASTVKVTVTPDEYSLWSQLSVAAGSSLTEQAEVALRDHFKRLGRRRGRAA